MKEIIRLVLFACCFFIAPQLKVMAQDKPAEDKPAYEQRNQPVNKDDLLILKRAGAILSDETKWNRKDTRDCDPEDTVWSLFCALQKASIEILGRYDHRRAALQEVRFAIEEAAKGKDFEHRLMDFNNLPTTHFEDIKKILKTAIDNVAARLKQRKKHAAANSASGKPFNPVSWSLNRHYS